MQQLQRYLTLKIVRFPNIVFFMVTSNSMLANPTSNPSVSFFLAVRLFIVIPHICEMHCPANVIMLVADVLAPDRHQCIANPTTIVTLLRFPDLTVHINTTRPRRPVSPRRHASPRRHISPGATSAHDVTPVPYAITRQIQTAPHRLIMGQVSLYQLCSQRSIALNQTDRQPVAPTWGTSTVTIWWRTTIRHRTVVQRQGPGQLSSGRCWLGQRLSKLRVE